MSFRRAMVGLMVVALAGFVSSAFAAQRAAQPREQTVTGEVKAAEPNAAYAATVEFERERAGAARKVTLRVTNDEQGKKLAKEANGKTAEIKGTVETKDRERWITVKEFKIVEPKAAPAAPKAAPAAPKAAPAAPKTAPEAPAAK